MQSLGGHARAASMTPDERKAAARIAAHAAFDPIWRGGLMTRKAAYAWLKIQLGTQTDPHIGDMDALTTLRVVAACRVFLDSLRATHGPLPTL